MKYIVCNKYSQMNKKCLLWLIHQNWSQCDLPKKEYSVFIWKHTSKVSSLSIYWLSALPFLNFYSLNSCWYFRVNITNSIFISFLFFEICVLYLFNIYCVFLINFVIKCLNSLYGIFQRIRFLTFLYLISL